MIWWTKFFIHIPQWNQALFQVSRHFFLVSKTSYKRCKILFYLKLLYSSLTICSHKILAQQKHFLRYLVVNVVFHLSFSLFFVMFHLFFLILFVFPAVTKAYVLPIDYFLILFSYTKFYFCLFYIKKQKFCHWENFFFHHLLVRKKLVNYSTIQN